jgi:hypothetical protein
MTISFIQSIDTAIKTAIWTKFGPSLDLITDQNKELVFAPKELAQRKIAEKRGESSVEFISVWRNNIELDWKRQQSFMGKEGLSLNYVDSTTKAQVVTITGVPVNISYDIFLWSRDLDKITKATEAYLQWLHNRPQLVIYYDGQYEMNMYMHLGNIEDVSDYNIYEKGQYFVSKFNFTLEAWALTTISSRTILKIVIDFFLREGQKPNYSDTLLNEWEIEATV